jgi:hypothetical protein
MEHLKFAQGAVAALTSVQRNMESICQAAIEEEEENG